MRIDTRTSSCRAAVIAISLLLVGAVFLTAGDCWASKRVKLQFQPGWAPAGVDEASVQSQVVQRFQDHFGFAGTNMYVFTNCNTTDYDKRILINTEKPAEDCVVGSHVVCKSDNYVYGGTIKSAFANTPGLLNSAGVARVVARTAAHEAGHHWGQDHPPNDGANATNTMGRPSMSGRVNTDSGFSSAQKTEMASYINSTKNKGDAGGDDHLNSVATVFGQYPDTYGDIGDDGSHFTVVTTLGGDINLYEFGWMNVYGVFVPKIQPGFASDVVSMFCKYEIDFAIRHIVTGEVYTASGGWAVVGFQNPIPPEMSSCPVVEKPYYATVSVDFPSQGFFATLDALPTNPTCGFMYLQDTFPGTSAVREWGVLILAVLLVGYAAWRISRRLKLAPAR